MAPGWRRPLPQILVLGFGLVLMRAAAGEQAPGMRGSEDGKPRTWGWSETEFGCPENRVKPGNREDTRICDLCSSGSEFQVGEGLTLSFIRSPSFSFATCPTEVWGSSVPKVRASVERESKLEGRRFVLGRGHALTLVCNGVCPVLVSKNREGAMGTLPSIPCGGAPSIR